MKETYYTVSMLNHNPVFQDEICEKDFGLHKTINLHIDNTLLELKQKIFTQINEFEKNMKYPTIVLINPIILELFYRFEDSIYRNAELNKIYGLTIIPDETVSIEDMVEVRGVINR